MPLGRAMEDWKQPRENSIEALQHGMQFGDGVEFDLRVDGDGELVIFHDEFAPGESPMLDRCVENLPTDYLKSVGIPTLSELLSKKNERTCIRKLKTCIFLFLNFYDAVMISTSSERNLLYD